jgi:hypothetical protein
LDQGDFPGAFTEFATQLSMSSLRVNYIEPRPHRNYVMEWNLNVQRQLSESISVMLGYTGSRGVHQPFRVEDMNIPLPDIKIPEGYVWSAAATAAGPVSPSFGQVEGLMWLANSSYHALQAQIKKNMSHGLQAQASFTWGRSIDTSSAGSIGDGFHNSVSSLPFFDPKLNRGPSDFNVGRNLVVNFEWEIPGPKARFAAWEWILGGWQLGGILESSSGLPFSVIISGDPLMLGNGDPFGRPNHIAGPGCSNPVNPGNPDMYIKLQCFDLPMQVPAIAGVCQTYGFRPPDPNATPPDPGSPGIPGTCANLLGNSGRNQYTGPSLFNVDMSLFKNMRFKKISEKFNAQFRVEVFNIFNHPNFAPPVDTNILFDNTGAAIPGAGALTATVTTSRQIQFALKLIW